MKRVLGIVAAIALVVGGQYILRGRSTDAREKLMAEVRVFDQFQQHRALLTGTIDEIHADVADRYTSRRGTSRARFYELDYDGYRAAMYRAMGEALLDAGHADAANDLVMHQMRAR